MSTQSFGREPSRWSFRLLPALVRAVLWVSETARRPWQHRRALAQARQAQVSPGEILVSFPAAGSDRVMHSRALEAVRWAEKGPRGERFTLSADPQERRARRDIPPPPMRRDYRVLTTQPGTEADTIRRVRAFAWLVRRLYRIDPRVDMIRCPLARPAALNITGLDAAGEEVEFLPAYLDERAEVTIPGDGYRTVRVLVIDQEIEEDAIPARVDHLGVVRSSPEGVRLVDARLEPTAHGTIVTAIVADLAPMAELSVLAVPLRPTGDVSLWTLLQPLIVERDYDLVNFSWEFETIDDKASFVATMFADLSGHGHGPMYVCPTGNARPGNPISTMAFPARVPSVIAIGAMHERSRSPDSRYGTKDGDRKDEWWLCPGGTKDAPVARFGGQYEHGTSFAAAFATGLLARTLRLLELPHDKDLTSVLDILDQLDAAIARTSRGDALRIQAERLRFSVQAMNTELLERLRATADITVIDDHMALEHGLGRLRAW